MPTMDEAEMRAFLAAEPARTAKLALVRKDGQPIVAPIWIAFDGDDIVFNTNEKTVKGKILQRDPRVALCVDDDRPPFTFVTLQGEATISRVLDEVLHWATVLGGRYMGADRAEEYGSRNGVPGELLVRVRVTRMFGERDLAD
jgi:PPOX class probable F420-dependent enzyme